MAIIKNILALDVGQVRIGVAVASLVAKMPRPLTTINSSSEVYADIQKLADEQDAQIIVVGLPRGLDGQTTEQTNITDNFIMELKQNTNLQIYKQDEALTSKKAKEELESKGRPYSKEDIDALAATYILEDFLHENADRLKQVQQ